MTSTAKEHRSAGDVVDETCDRYKKSRRVSFSHTTVHIFKYDEESESPANSNPGGSCQPEDDEETVGFLGHQSLGDDSVSSAPDEDEEEDVMRLKILHVADSSSPGSGVGSVTSNEDENFFGPVSSSFINAGRLSESGISDDMNYDITLDSTAFSMHFKNVAPLDDCLTNSAGSMRTPSGDTTPVMPSTFLFQGSKTEKLATEKSTVKMNAPTDENKISPIVKDPSSYDYGKLSQTLESLMDQVNSSMQSNAPIDNCPVISSNCSPVEVGGDKKQSKEEVQFCNQNLLVEQSTHNVQFSSLPAGQPTSETLLTTDATTGHSNDEIQDCGLMDCIVVNTQNVLVPPTCSYGFKNVHDGTHTDAIVVNGKSSNLQSPPNEELQSDSNIRSADSQLELFKNLASDVEFSPDFSSVCVLPIPSMSGTKLQLDASRIVDTPKLAAKLFNSSRQEFKCSIEGQDQQQLLCNSVQSSPKMVSISVKEPATPMQTPDTTAKLYHFSALEGFISSLQDKARKLPDFSVPSQLGLRESPASKETDSLQMKFIKQKISEIKKRIVGSSVKSRMQFDYDPAISMKDHFIADSYGSLENTKDNACINHASNSDVRAAGFNQCTNAFETLDDGQSEKSLVWNNFNRSNLPEQLCTPDTCFSLIEQRVADLKGLNKNMLDQKVCCDAAFIGDREKQQACNTENAGGGIANCSVTPEIEGDTEILSPDHAHGDVAEDHVGKASKKHWTDVHLKISEGISQLLPQSVSELSLHKLNAFEDLLEELKTARKYASLCPTMRNHDSFSNMYQKRVMYARSLIEMLGLAKQRNKLMCIKLKKLQNEEETFRTKVEECSKLKSMYSRLHVFSKRATGLHELCDSRQQEEHNKILALKQELQMLEQRSKLLLQYFESSCKLKGKMSCDGIIEVINEHLLRRNFCMEIQQYTQVWKFSDIMAQNDHYEIVLNYCNLLFQRFILSKNQISSIVTKSICNAENIEKKYPNMNAHVAFEFVFKLNVEHKISASKGIYMETVGTNLLLGTLVDVLQEIFLSRLELMNLLSSTFVMRSSGELELQLYFCGSNHGRKLVCEIDLTSLKHGVYPDDPSAMKLRVDKQQTTLPSPVVDSVIFAVRSLQGGHLVILRLCRCVSQLVHNSS